MSIRDKAKNLCLYNACHREKIGYDPDIPYSDLGLCDTHTFFANKILKKLVSRDPQKEYKYAC